MGRNASPVFYSVTEISETYDPCPNKSASSLLKKSKFEFLRVQLVLFKLPFFISATTMYFVGFFAKECKTTPNPLIQ